MTTNSIIKLALDKLDELLEDYTYDMEDTILITYLVISRKLRGHTKKCTLQQVSDAWKFYNSKEKPNE